jgi:hypothetical protein
MAPPRWVSLDNGLPIGATQIENASRPRRTESMPASDYLRQKNIGEGLFPNDIAEALLKVLHQLAGVGKVN